MDNTFEIDFSNLTIYKVNEDGDRMDMNLLGYPVSTFSGLRNLADELYDCRVYSRRVRNEIVETIDKRSEFLDGVQ